MVGHKPKIPRVAQGIAIHALPLGPMEGFVLSRIDAVATVTDIADLTSLDVTEVERILDKLIELGAVEWADGAVHLPRMSAKSIAPPRPSPTKTSMVPPKDVREVGSPRPGIDRRTPLPEAPPPRGAVSVLGASPLPPRAPLDGLGSPAPPGAPPPSAATGPRGPASVVHADPPQAIDLAADPDSGESELTPDDGIDLPLDRRKRIDDLYVALDLLDHYDVLGVGRKAAKNEIRSAYFELSKVFHPDTVFRKSVGNYRQRMEQIFKRLTEAYEVLGKKKARDEYDAYLSSIGEAREAEEALSGENEIPLELRTETSPGAPVAPAPEPPPPPAPAPPPTMRSFEAPRPASPPPPMPARSTPTEEGKRVARELLQKRLAGARPGTSLAAGGASAPTPAEPAPAERTKLDMVRDLASTLRSTAAHTGGLDRLTRVLADAQRASQQKDLASAVKHYRLAMALAPDREDIAAVHEELARELAASLAERYEQQAKYEEKHQKWASAATSWAKVVEGRPDDVRALRSTANALLEAKGDLHQARKLAQRAVELAPDDVTARLVLGKIFHAAGLALNARRELEVVRQLDPQNLTAAQLLKEISKPG